MFEMITLIKLKIHMKSKNLSKQKKSLRMRK